MTYTEDIQDRIAKISDEIGEAWMDHRLTEGKGFVDLGTDEELKARRAELLDSIAFDINAMEGIDEELALRADQAKARRDKITSDNARRTALYSIPPLTGPAYDYWLGWDGSLTGNSLAKRYISSVFR
ncbi:hypothetical protein OG474_29905 [Kribbella sp. NBC_01505]|uniref:hypothetical protein n=1 Tax=Kribbella sp. NBC_01505 TaxID=2903580 RepID=UPI0038650438